MKGECEKYSKPKEGDTKIKPPWPSALGVPSDDDDGPYLQVFRNGKWVRAH